MAIDPTSSQELDQAQQPLPRSCQNLTVLALERDEMDMEYVEEETKDYDNFGFGSET